MTEFVPLPLNVLDRSENNPVLPPVCTGSACAIMLGQRVVETNNVVDAASVDIES